MSFYVLNFLLKERRLTQDKDNLKSVLDSEESGESENKI